MRTAFIIILSVCCIVVSVSIAYYFILFLPQQQRVNTATLKKIEQQAIKTKENTENIPSTSTTSIENRLDDINNSIEQQNADMEYEQKRRGWCEQGGGIYYGNGSCITSQK